jgi:hypothetical protein
VYSSQTTYPLDIGTVEAFWPVCESLSQSQSQCPVSSLLPTRAHIVPVVRCSPWAAKLGSERKSVASWITLWLLG